jgi:hypothetical protein
MTQTNGWTADFRKKDAHNLFSVHSSQLVHTPKRNFFHLLTHEDNDEEILFYQPLYQLNLYSDLPLRRLPDLHRPSLLPGIEEDPDMMRICPLSTRVKTIRSRTKAHYFCKKGNDRNQNHSWERRGWRYDVGRTDSKERQY